MARSKRSRLGDDAPMPAPAAPPGASSIRNRQPKRDRRACEACASVGPEATVQLCLRRTGKPDGKFLGNQTDVCRLVESMGEADRESFYVFHLDVRHHIIDIDKVATGTQSSVQVHPREVFKGAMLSSAHALVFAHNHPSGEAVPSSQDRELTHRLKQTGDLVGIPVIDHIIVGRHGCHSMAAAGELGEAQTGIYKPLERPGRK